MTESGAESDSGVEVLAPARPRLPLVVASPHSGRRYPERFVNQSRLALAALRRSEDGFVDELIEAAPALGAPLIRALFPRCYVDVNREPAELDPAMFADPLPGYVNSDSARVRCGLGTVARVGASGAEIYRAPLPYAAVRRRLLAHYFPYHKALRGLLAAIRARFGYAVLIDCHSMPSQAVAGDDSEAADIVLGDCHGRACSPLITDRVEAFLRARGYRVGRNRPYAGGFTTKHYGRPAHGVHGLQIEIGRALYMDERRHRRGPAMARLKADLARLIEAIAEVELFAQAAE